MTELSKVHPDRDALLAQLAAILQTKDAWKDRVISSTGRTLLDLQAAIGAYDQYSIEAAFQEAFPESAKNKESLYAASNFAGVRYNRKSPAEVTVSLSHIAGATIQPYTQFTINGTYWFNRVPLVMTPTPQSFTLYQGKIVETSISGIGTDFQAYVSPEKDFMASDTDVLVKVNGNAIPVTTGGLWTRKGLAGVQDLSIVTGQMLLLFGSNLFGTKPTVNDTVSILYAVTFGADGNNLAVQAKRVVCPSDASISGTCSTVAQNGGNETNPVVYKNITPALWGAFDSAVTPFQYKALPMQYPGVIDAQVYAQREINPNALTWMNKMRVVLLTNTAWNENEWDQFVKFMNEKTMHKSHYVRRDPIQAPVDVVMDVYCSNFSNLTEIKAKVDAVINTLFSARQGILGFDFYRTDIENAAFKADKNIEYLVLKQPTTDLILSSLNVGKPKVTRASGGSIGAGSYDYAVSAVSALGGETAPANWSTVIVATGSNKFTLTWDPVQNVTHYKVWGRQTGGAMGLLATVPASTTTWTDDGTVAPTGLVPVEETIDSYYAHLQSLTINMFYSTRPKRLDEEA